MIDLADHPFSPENVRRESGVALDRCEAAWLRWCDRVEKIAGDFDGDNSAAAKAAGNADGFSVDDAHDAFMAGMPAEEYARIVEQNKIRKGRS